MKRELRLRTRNKMAMEQEIQRLVESLKAAEIKEKQLTEKMIKLEEQVEIKETNFQPEELTAHTVKMLTYIFREKL